MQEIEFLMLLPPWGYLGEKIEEISILLKREKTHTEVTQHDTNQCLKLRPKSQAQALAAELPIKKCVRGGTFLSPDTRSEGFLRGLNFFQENLKEVI